MSLTLPIDIDGHLELAHPQLGPVDILARGDTLALHLRTTSLKALPTYQQRSHLCHQAGRLCQLSGINLALYRNDKFTAELSPNQPLPLTHRIFNRLAGTPGWRWHWRALLS